MVTGCAWLIYGMGVLVDPRPVTMRSAAALGHLAPMEIWSMVWIFCGVVAMISSWARWPFRIELGFAAAIMPPMLWALSFTASWILGEYPDAWSGAVIWASMAARLAIVASWPTAPSLVEVRRE
jgi:hypothetical protein